ncbi:MAG: hypothetical protein BWY82_02733 [Verrucomicrobia bacterium ADurb.Bin474]|nr:MAG: hypothetical protein BWY82_02733 [Verrucomicrobia bacterium ADurb.Bin474]
MVGEKTEDLLDDVLVDTMFLHDLEQDRVVERHHRNGRACLADYCLVERDKRTSSEIEGLF